MGAGAAMRVIGVVLARLDSSRLPGKSLRLCAGLPLVGHAVARARQVAGLAELVLATTDRAIDDPLADYAAAERLALFRGSTADVAGRALACARERGADYLLRINGDSPFLDPALVGEGLTACAEQPDLVTNLLGRTFPYGISLELVRTASLARAHAAMADAAEREHVTKYFYDHAAEFRVRSLVSPVPELAAARLVVDTPEDLARFERLAERLGPRLHSAPFEEVARAALALERVAAAGNAGRQSTCYHAAG